MATFISAPESIKSLINSDCRIKRNSSALFDSVSRCKLILEKEDQYEEEIRVGELSVLNIEKNKVNCYFLGSEKNSDGSFKKDEFLIDDLHGVAYSWNKFIQMEDDSVCSNEKYLPFGGLKPFELDCFQKVNLLGNTPKNSTPYISGDFGFLPLLKFHEYKDKIKSSLSQYNAFLNWLEEIKAIRDIKGEMEWIERDGIEESQFFLGGTQFESWHGLVTAIDLACPTDHMFVCDGEVFKTALEGNLPDFDCEL